MFCVAWDDVCNAAASKISNVPAHHHIYIYDIKLNSTWLANLQDEAATFISFDTRVQFFQQIFQQIIISQIWGISSSLILHSHLLHPTLPFPQCLSFCLGNQPAKSWKGNAVQICYSNMRGWVHWGFDYYDTSHCVMDAEWHLPYVMFKVYLVPGCWLNILANLLLISIACSPH